MLEQGMTAEQIKKARKRKKFLQENHHDDCGSDCGPLERSCHWSSVLGADGSLGAAIDYSFGDNLELCSTSAESSGEDAEHILLDNFCLYLSGSSGGAEGHQGRSCSLEDFVAYLSRPALAGTLDLVEIFGGEGGVGKIGVRRRLRTGENFDLQTGFDLTKAADQRLVLKYLNEHKPFVVIFAPPLHVLRLLVPFKSGSAPGDVE